jgi:hypothetical protein
MIQLFKETISTNFKSLIIFKISTDHLRCNTGHDSAKLKISESEIFDDVDDGKRRQRQRRFDRQ